MFIPLDMPETMSWSASNQIHHRPNRYQRAKPRFTKARGVMLPSNDFKSRQFPYRLLAFTSDLGTIAHLIKRPKLSWLGWSISAPYYAWAVVRQPAGQKRREELLYQATANGLFPYMWATLGTKMAKTALFHFPPIRQRIPQSRHPFFQFAAVLTAVLCLTPTLGDYFSKFITAHGVSLNQKRVMA